MALWHYGTKFSAIYDFEPDVNRMWDLILDKINEILSVMCPMKRVYIRSNKSPWITPNIVYYINQRSRISKFFRITGSPHMFELSRFFFFVRNAKSVYIQENLRMNRNNPRKFWQILRHVFVGEKILNTDIDFVDPKTNIKIPKDNIPNFLNDYFVHIGNSNIPTVPTDQIQPRM